MPYQIKRRSAGHWSLALIATLLTAAGSFGQTTTSTDGMTPSFLTPGTPQGSYALSDFDTVNLFNGNLNFDLPLKGIGARGEAAMQSSLAIEQRWRVKHHFWSNGYYWVSYPEYNWWPSKRPGYGPGVVVGRTDILRTGECFTDNGYNSYPYAETIVTRLTFITPNGTEYELHDQQTNGRPMAQPYCGGNGQGASRGTVFESWDGTAATFISDAVIYDNTYNMYDEPLPFYPSGYLLLKDGTRYRIDDGLVTWLQDRNGNRLTFAYVNGRVTSITDSLNRQVTIAYDVQDVAPYGLCDRITFTGLGEVSRTIRVSHTTLSNARRADFSVNTYAQLFPELNGVYTGPPYNAPFDPVVTSAVWLPDDGVNRRAYKFYYNNYAELARVELPTGGAYEYDYAAGFTNGAASGVFGDGPDNYDIYRRVVEKRSYTGGGLESKVTFSRPETWNSSTLQGQTLGYVVRDVSDAGGALVSRSKSYFYGQAGNRGGGGFIPWRNGKEYRTELIGLDGATVLRKIDRTWQQRANLSWWTSWWGWGGSMDNQPEVDARVVTMTTTVEPAGANLVSVQTSVSPVDGSIGFDQYNNQTDSWEYDFGSGGPGPFVRRTHTGYVTTAAYVNASANPALGASLRALVLQQWISTDAAGSNKVSRIDFGYDQYGLAACPGITGHDAAFGTGFATRGNRTSVTRYASASNATGAVTGTALYDIAGNAISTTDARGKTTLISFADSFSDGLPRNTYAFPTSSTLPAPDPGNTGYGSPTNLVSTTVYDFRSGLVTTTTDVNGKTTTLSYADDNGNLDPLNRLRKVTRPDGGTTSYSFDKSLNAGVLCDYVRTVTALDSSRSVEFYAFYDGLGRAARSFLHEGGSPAVFLTTDTQYDAAGRVRRVSNPYRTAGSGDPINPSNRWTTTAYDALGRTLSVTTPDGAAATTSYSGNTETAADQAGKARRSVTDALGRLVRVDEPDASGSLGSAAAPAQPTYYDYDALSNLRKVNQGGQLRFYMYDSMSRLIRASNPEQAANAGLALSDPVTGNSQWSAAFSYDGNGNLTQRTDARGVLTTFQYDSLNRNIITTYSGGATTPEVRRHYDGATNGRGRLYWSEAAGVSATAFDAYDAVGRPTQYHQIYWVNNAWGQPFNVSRAYDKAGNVTSQTYPSGHTVTYNYDAAGRLGDNGSQLAFGGALGDGVSRAYATGITYSAFGGIQEERYGTQTPLYRKLHYNVRGQLFDIRLSTVPWATDQWNWNRGAIVNYFSSNYAWEGDPNTPAGTDNNGNLMLQQYWSPADDAISNYGYTQDTFSYDYLNRLSSVSERHGGPWGQSGQDFAQAYTNDRWGNLSVNLGQSPNVPAPQYDYERGDLQYTNRLYAPGDLSLPMEQRRMRYDSAGNLTHDSYTGAGGRNYDAENRMTSAYDSTGNWAYYTYDADGRRVKRQVANEETWLVYGMNGELLAEYRAAAAPFIADKEYGYRGSELLVTMSSGDAQRLKRFVKNLYYNCLARDPSPSELQQKMNDLGQAGVQGGETQLITQAKSIARGLFESAEYIARNRTTEQYVTDLYIAYLQRGPDTPGLNHWVNNTNQHGRGATLNAFEASIEFGALASTVYGTASGGEDQRVDTFVRNFYYGAFQRDPTSTEAQAGRQRLNNAAAVSRAQVIVEARAWAVELIQSTNYNAGHTDAQYVTDLYLAFLQRAPDGLGFNFWLGKVQAEGRGSALAGFRDSIEYGELAGTLHRETFWLVPDRLATPRMVTDKTGSLAGVKRHDYLPFGQELGANAGGRTDTQGYGAVDNIRQKFTGYERDGETDLDYAQARYYASAQGRFTSVDPLAASAHAATPQTLNRYSYAVNNPLRYTDPTGMGAEEDPQRQQPPPPPAPAPSPSTPPLAPPPIDSSLEGSPAYVQQQALAPRPTISVTAEATRPVQNGPLGDGMYISGVLTLLRIQVIGDDGQPMAGVFVTEHNTTISSIPPRPGFENTNAVQTDANGFTPLDVVSCNALFTNYQVPPNEALDKFIEQIDNRTECATRQTLTISAPGYGLLGTAEYTRRFSNLDSPGGSRLPNRDATTGRRANNFRTTPAPVTNTTPGPRGAPLAPEPSGRGGGGRVTPTRPRGRHARRRRRQSKRSTARNGRRAGYNKRPPRAA